MSQPIRVRWTCPKCRKELEEDLAGMLAHERPAHIARADEQVRAQHARECNGKLKRLDR